MPPILRNVLALLLGGVVGMIVNMGLVTIGPSIIPTPEGFDMEALKGFDLLQPKHFIFPFLGHALGTLVGAFIAAKIGVSRQMLLAFVIGVFFLVGGITMVQMVDAPTWFDALDLLVAYLPMAWIGGTLAGGNRTITKH